MADIRIAGVHCLCHVRRDAGSIIEYLLLAKSIFVVNQQTAMVVSAYVIGYIFSHTIMNVVMCIHSYDERCTHYLNICAVNCASKTVERETYHRHIQQSEYYVS